MKEQIESVIKQSINPVLKLHNGSCTLIGVDKGIVTLKLNGGCAGCPSSQITLFNGIAPILMEKIPGIKDVILG